MQPPERNANEINFLALRTPRKSSRIMDERAEREMRHKGPTTLEFDLTRRLSGSPAPARFGRAPFAITNPDQSVPEAICSAM